MSDKKLRGRAVLITGGGAGIGKACAARDGAAVTIAGRTAASLERAATEIAAQARQGGSVTTMVADVTDEDSVRALLARAAEPASGLHGVVANAGGGMLMGYAEVDTDEFKRVLDLNVLGAMLCIKHSLPLMIAGGGGSFVGMSSLAGRTTPPFFHAYCAGKAGIEAMIRNAADEYGKDQVRFNAIRPGFIATEIMEFIPRDSEVYRSNSHYGC